MEGRFDCLQMDLLQVFQGITVPYIFITMSFSLASTFILTLSLCIRRKGSKKRTKSSSPAVVEKSVRMSLRSIVPEGDSSSTSFMLASAPIKPPSTAKTISGERSLELRSTQPNENDISKSLGLDNTKSKNDGSEVKSIQGIFNEDKPLRLDVTVPSSIETIAGTQRSDLSKVAALPLDPVPAKIPALSAVSPHLLVDRTQFTEEAEPMAPCDMTQSSEMERKISSKSYRNAFRKGLIRQPPSVLSETGEVDDEATSTTTNERAESEVEVVANFGDISDSGSSDGTDSSRKPESSSQSINDRQSSISNRESNPNDHKSKINDHKSNRKHHDISVKMSESGRQTTGGPTRALISPSSQYVI